MVFYHNILLLLTTASRCAGKDSMCKLMYSPTAYCHSTAISCYHISIIVVCYYTMLLSKQCILELHKVPQIVKFQSLKNATAILHRTHNSIQQWQSPPFCTMIKSHQLPTFTKLDTQTKLRQCDTLVVIINGVANNFTLQSTVLHRQAFVN